MCFWMVMANADAGLEKEGAVPGDCLGSAASDTYHCDLVFECTYDIKLPSLSWSPYSGAKFKGKIP